MGNGGKEVQGVIDMAIRELEIIVNTSSLKHRFDSYEKFLANKTYQKVWREDSFITGISRILKDTHLKKEIYEMFAGLYHFRDIEPYKLDPSSRLLYDILSRHCHLEKSPKKDSLSYGLLAAAFLCIRFAARNWKETGGVALGAVLVMAAMFFGFRYLLKYFSRWRIHLMYGTGLLAFQVIALLTEIYGFLLGNPDSGDLLGGMLFLFSGAYVIITVCAFVIYQIYVKIVHGIGLKNK